MKLEDSLKLAMMAIVKNNTDINNIDFIPSFTTTRSGYQVSFSREAEHHILESSKKLSENQIPRIRYDQKEHSQLTRQALAETYIELQLEGLSPHAITYLQNQVIKGRIKQEIATVTGTALTAYTYHLPASATGAEATSPFILGPVEMYNRAAWLDLVDLPETAHDFGGEDNRDWRNSLKRALAPRSDEPLTLLTSSIYSAIEKSEAMLKITVEGYGPNLSYQMACILGKTALDSLSLISGNKSSFIKNTLHTERRPPIQTHRVVETNGFLHLPGSALSDVLAVQPLDAELIASKYSQYLDAFSYILNGIANASSHRNPELCARWATALDWYGEACRETSDSIAIAKYGTSLDVLSCCGGKAPAIARMVSSLTTIPLNENIMLRGDKLSLQEAVKRIYEKGRSEILHGNKYDRMQSHEDLKGLATHFARHTLLSGALALANYDGPDIHDGFCKMPPAPTTKTSK